MLTIYYLTIPCQCLLILSLAPETRDSVGMLSQSDVFLVDPDKLDIKRLSWLSIYDASLEDFRRKGS